MRIIRVFRLLLACFCCCCQSLAAPPRPRPFESPSSPPLKSLPQRILPPPPSSRLVQLSLNNVSPTPTHADELRDAVRLDGPLKEFIALSPPPPLATSPINRIIDLTALLYIPRKHRIVRLVTGLEQLPLAILSSHVFTKLDLVAAARLRSTCQTFALACRIPFNKFNSVSSFLKILIAYSQQQQNYQYDGNHVHIVIDFIPPSIFSYFHSIILQPPFNQLSVNEHYLLIYLLMLNDSWSSELADAIGEQIDLFDEASRYNPAETWEVKKEYQTSLVKKK